MSIEQLKEKIKLLENDKQNIQDNYSVLYTNCIKIALKFDYPEIIKYIKPGPQELINAKDSDQEIINEPIEKPKTIDKPVIIALTENTLKNTLLKWIDLK